MATRADSHDLSNAVQDYAKAIWTLAQRSTEPVSTSAIADRLEVSPASASAMVKRLEVLGLATREDFPAEQRAVHQLHRGATHRFEALEPELQQGRHHLAGRLVVAP